METDDSNTSLNIPADIQIPTTLDQTELSVWIYLQKYLQYYNTNGNSDSSRLSFENEAKNVQTSAAAGHIYGGYIFIGVMCAEFCTWTGPTLCNLNIS